MNLLKRTALYVHFVYTETINFTHEVQVLYFLLENIETADSEEDPGYMSECNRIAKTLAMYVQSGMDYYRDYIAFLNSLAVKVL